MTDLAAFLRARLDEDEADANEVHQPRDCGCIDRDAEFSPEPVYCGCGYPARVLRDVQAGRAILDRYEEPLAGLGLGDQLQRGQERMGLLYAIEALAAVYSDHEDYDPAWSGAQ